ncbi:aminotransferase class V-fold PLP-dependent enzyme [Tropicibacter naphthalenivorans]|uniref:Cysteine sulfinate desulfinase n=1 Tax=Tropicibacter naphthalenivorans TaxID=441103 RepID=A0A0P1GKA5_9RHOB|nr:aminotransferase class V-fold PLP-dependent enzyme [Tropicibacter naphthalenivorans]CUH75823.1 Cysteine sulfinate desulfinase [Tropicibacter naphthalenivorans]SMC42044.1 Selenocysteine lyase/Cysteine desulfurase [Tropicibacter naphthalenivorans]
MFDAALLDQIRARFAHVDSCPFTGARIFFENAGGALTLKSVVETTTRFAAIPDNQGRDNAASHALVDVITKSRADAMRFFNASEGAVLFGESGTELLFRLIQDACLGAGPGIVLGSTVEHPASRSACTRWAEVSGRQYIQVPHDDATGQVTPQAYAEHVTPDTAVATILHTSPVTGMAMDLPAIAAAIRAKAPNALIIVDGIQHACHGGIDVSAAGIDGYVISPYKVFSRHGYGIAWASDRLTALRHDALTGAPAGQWELGTRDTGAYATFSDVVAYFDWLGGTLTTDTDPRARLTAAAKAIHAHEHALTQAMLRGIDNLPGLTDLPGVHIIGGADNPAREGLVSFYSDSVPTAQIVAALNDAGIRTHIRKADHYSGNILTPLGQPDCVRVSLAHYNSPAEVRSFLSAVQSILAE